jgi:signal transduction histidine kinase
MNVSNDRNYLILACWAPAEPGPSTVCVRDSGIGLGLVVVKNLVEANGGTVKVASEAGKGATFFVTLPCDSSTIESA